MVRGLGWAMVPEHVVNSSWYMDGLIELSAENIPGSLLVQMGIVKRRDKGAGPILDWMIREIQSMFKLVIPPKSNWGQK